MHRRVGLVYNHISPCQSLVSSSLVDDVMIVDGDMDDSSAIALFLACSVRIGTEHARIWCSKASVWLNISECVFFRWVTHHIRRNDLRKLKKGETSAQELRRLCSPIQFVRSVKNGVDLGSKAPWQQIYNVWQETAKFDCFGCAPNETSLRLVFFDGPDDVVACEHYITQQSFPGVSHGGILCTICDEVAYFAYVKATKKTSAMTKTLTMEYFKPVQSNQFVSCTAVADDQGKVRVEVFNAKGILCCVATVIYSAAKGGENGHVKFNL